jgi:hypothetical protein
LTPEQTIDSLGPRFLWVDLSRVSESYRFCKIKRNKVNDKRALCGHDRKPFPGQKVFGCTSAGSIERLISGRFSLGEVAGFPKLLTFAKTQEQAKTHLFQQRMILHEDNREYRG